MTDFLRPVEGQQKLVAREDIQHLVSPSTMQALLSRHGPASLVEIETAKGPDRPGLDPRYYTMALPAGCAAILQRVSAALPR